jgi:5-methylthioadenosine/S-adenosylhomocysteine deaminase
MNSIRTLLVAGMALAVATVAAAAQDQKAQDQRRPVDLLVRGGAVVTMDPNRRVLERGAVAVAGDRIVAVGLTADVESRYRGRRVIEARGKIVLPGLINLHTHSSMIFYRGLVDDYSLDTWGQVLRPLHHNDDRPGFKHWADAVACLEMLKRGTTTFVEMYYDPELVADVARAAGMRAMVTLRLPFEQQTGKFDPVRAEAEWDKLHRAWKDDPLITPGLAAHAPHTVPTEMIRFTAQLAKKYDVPLIVHLAEGKSETDQIAKQFGGKSPTEYLDSLGFLGPKVLAVHSIRLSDSDIQLLKQRGVSVAHNPESNAKIGNGVARIPDLLRAGIHVGLGTDSGVTNNNLDLFEEMDMAVKLQRALHQDPTILTAKQALEMATIGGATAIHKEKEIGSLEAGKKADLIIVDADRAELQPVYDYYSHLVYVAQGGDVQTSIVNGRVLMERRRVLTMNVAEIKRKAEEYRNMVVQDMKASPTADRRR